MLGRAVDVLRPTVRYEGGDAERSWERETVEGVLVAPAATSVVGESDRPDGTRAALSLSFPKSYAKSLRGCLVEVDGERFAVVGDPRCWGPGCPTRWNREAEAAKADG